MFRMSETKKRILFLCTGNCCRSQMAEGLLRHSAGDRFEVLSAGSHPAGFVHPLAIEALQEIEIDITGQRSKSIDEFLPPEGEPPDVIISVCSAADNACPNFPADVERIHLPFDDPIHAEGTHAEKMCRFREIRDQINTALESQFA